MKKNIEKKSLKAVCKEKINKLNFIKIKHWSLKVTLREWKQVTEQEKIFTKHLSEKDAYTEYIKNYQNSVIIKWTPFKNE